MKISRGKGTVCIILKPSDRFCIVSDPQVIFKMPPMGQNCAIIDISTDNKSCCGELLESLARRAEERECLVVTFTNNCTNCILTLLYFLYYLRNA